jgi:hypothetical protein
MKGEKVSKDMIGQQVFFSLDYLFEGKNLDVLFVK